MTNLANIPAELKELPIWAWHKEDKSPYNPRMDKHASVDDPKTLGTFDKALEAAKVYHGKGVGIVLNAPYCGIDLDYKGKEGEKPIFNPRTDEIEPWASEIVKQIASYTEISLSGKGLHIICRAVKPGARCRIKQMEIYSHNRFFCMTGNILESRGVIEDRQSELESFYKKELGGVTEGEAEPVSIDELTLDPDAVPPADKLDLLIRNRDFKKTWDHKREDLPSPSDYDASLAGFAVRKGWSDGEIANLIIAFRRRWGDLEKALRPDYIKRTLAKVKPKTDDMSVLDLLPFKVIKVIQIGERDAQYELVLDNGKKIEIESTEVLRSERRASHALYELDYHLSTQAEKKWKEITIALRKMAEVKPTISRDETTSSWVRGYINYEWGIYKDAVINTEDELKAFALGNLCAAPGKDGKAYVKVEGMTRHARVAYGWNKNVYDVAADLTSLGFTKITLDLRKGGKRYRPTMWESPPGFYSYKDDV